MHNQRTTVTLQNDMLHSSLWQKSVTQTLIGFRDGLACIPPEFSALGEVILAVISDCWQSIAIFTEIVAVELIQRFVKKSTIQKLAGCDVKMDIDWISFWGILRVCTAETEVTHRCDSSNLLHRVFPLHMERSPFGEMLPQSENDCFLCAGARRAQVFKGRYLSCCGPISMVKSERSNRLFHHIKEVLRIERYLVRTAHFPPAWGIHRRRLNLEQKNVSAIILLNFGRLLCRLFLLCFGSLVVCYWFIGLYKTCILRMFKFHWANALFF